MLLLLLSLLLVLSMSMSAIGFAAILQYNDITKAPGIGQGWRGFHDFNHISFELDASLASTVCTPFHESITWPCSCSSGDFSLSCFFAFSLLCFFFFCFFAYPQRVSEKRQPLCGCSCIFLPKMYILFSIQFNSFATQHSHSDSLRGLSLFTDSRLLGSRKRGRELSAQVNLCAHTQLDTKSSAVDSRIANLALLLSLPRWLLSPDTWIFF